MADKPAAQATQDAMGTVMTHRAFGPQAREAVAAACEEVARVEGHLSRFLPGSEVSRVNRSAGIRSESVSHETYDLLAQALEVSRRCPGCFDVTIAPLVTLWSQARESRTQPDAASIQHALSRVDYRDLILDPGSRTAGLRRAGQSLDLGGIGKGLAADRIVEVLRGYGISSAYSNLGGNVVTVGARPDGQPWQVGIQHPRHETGLIGAVAVAGQTVVTSGDYQRCFIDRQGQRHHHILDPTTGHPAHTGLISVSIVTARSVTADPLATALFVAGLDSGFACLRSFPQTEAILVDSNLHVYVTGGLRSRFRPAPGIDVTILN